jgi:hypothetical protein
VIGTSGMATSGHGLWTIMDGRLAPPGRQR